MSAPQIELFTAHDAKERRKRYLEVQIGLDQAASAYFLELGGLYLELDDLVRAEGAFRRYILRVSTDARGHRGLAETYRRLDRLDEAKSSDELAAALESRTDVDGGATDIRDDINGSELKGEP